jgi:hypothetical protein
LKLLRAIVSRVAPVVLIAELVALVAAANVVWETSAIGELLFCVYPDEIYCFHPPINKRTANIDIAVYAMFFISLPAPQSDAGK